MKDLIWTESGMPDDPVTGRKRTMHVCELEVPEDAGAVPGDTRPDGRPAAYVMTVSCFGGDIVRLKLAYEGAHTVEAFSHGTLGGLDLDEYKARLVEMAAGYFENNTSELKGTIADSFRGIRRNDAMLALLGMEGGAT